MAERSSDRLKSRFFDTTPPPAASYERLDMIECIGPLKFYGILIMISITVYVVTVILLLKIKIPTRWRRAKVAPKPERPHHEVSQSANDLIPSQHSRPGPRLTLSQIKGSNMKCRKTSIWHNKMAGIPSVALPNRHVIHAP